MVVFFAFIIIGVVVARIFTRDDRGGGVCWTGDWNWTGDNIRVLCVIAGILLGAGASFWGGSFVKKEIVAEKYVIFPMIFNGKTVGALVEDSSSYIFQIKETTETETRLIKHNLSKEEIFFDLNEGEERYLEIRRSRTCNRNMWVWFFYGNTGLIESKAVLKEGDNFLTLPRYYSL